MRIMVFSDTHGNIDNCITLLNRIPADAILHAGDLAGDGEALSYLFGGLPVFYVRGNCDMLSDAKAEQLVSLDGITILLTHGHLYRVKQGFGMLAQKALETKADITVFGHTHQGFDGFVNGARLLNPGTMRHGKASYAVIETEDGHIRTSVITYV